MNSPYDCTVCYERYDEKDRFPMVLGKCGHTVCLRCANQLTACPMRCLGFNPDDMRKNFAIIQFLQEHKRITENPQQKSPSFRSRKVPSRTESRIHQPPPTPPRNHNRQPASHFPTNSLLNLFQTLSISHNGVAIRTRRVTNIKPVRTRSQGQCLKGHPCTQFKEAPPQTNITCDVCKQSVKGEMLSCRECNFDVCCDGGVADTDFEDYTCNQGHPLGYNPTGNTHAICIHCEMGLSDSPHWECRTCQYNVCEECVSRLDFEIGEGMDEQDQSANLQSQGEQQGNQEDPSVQEDNNEEEDNNYEESEQNFQVEDDEQIESQEDYNQENGEENECEYDLALDNSSEFQ